MGRASKSEAAVNRARVVETASSMLRKNGPDGVAIDGLMTEAGLTRGGFYKMFGSKDALAEEACTSAFDEVDEAWSQTGEGDADTRLRRLIEFYLAPKVSGGECPMASLSGDVARVAPGRPLRRAFSAGVRKLVTLFAGDTPSDRDLTAFAAMVGAVVLRRANDDQVLGSQIQDAVLRFVGGARPLP